MNKIEYFTKRFKEIVKLYPDRIAIKSTTCPQGFTYKKLDLFSSKVYAYLKAHNIGKEDRVLIILPRGIRVITAMLGVIKAGACVSLLEEGYSAERIEFIKKDYNPKIIIDNAVLEEAGKYEPLDGYEIADDHDACFAIYTSGSTGKPKGVLHEYGKLHLQIISTGKTEIHDITNVGVLTSPLNFFASFNYFIYRFYVADTVYLVGYSIAKNLNAYLELLEKEKATTAFLTPTHVRTVEKFPSTLKYIAVGGEALNDLYRDDVKLINSYGSSESGFIITRFVLDKPYKITPVGKSTAGLDVFVVDEEGNKLGKNEKGEICIPNLFTRGYINLPDKTAEVFKDGLYHMGDIGYFDDNDNLVICGRKDDMIKINGNRIEPAEIEYAVKTILGVENCVAKGFNEERRSYIACYLLSSEVDANTLNIEKIKNDLKKLIPYYMVPSYFINVDSYPKNPNGKLMRNDLKAPDSNDYVDEYVAPSTELEKYFASLFSKALRKEKIGVNDDFFLIGGDSLSSMVFFSNCKYKELTLNDLYNHPTVKQIAEFYSENYANSEDIDSRNKKALRHEQILQTELVCQFDALMYSPGSSMWDLGILSKLVDDVDLNRLINAINKTLEHHPCFSTIITLNDNMEFVQKYCPEKLKKVEIIHLSDEEFEKEINSDDFIKRFKILNSILYKAIIYITPTSKYLFTDVYHFISDGTSLNLFYSDIDALYKNPNTKLEPDYYYLYLRNIQKDLFNHKDETIIKYYNDVADKYLTNNKILVKTDFDNGYSMTFGSQQHPNDLKKCDINSLATKFGVTNNIFLSAAILLAIAKYNKQHKAFFYAITNGRDSALKKNICGLLYSSLPFGADFSIENTPRKLFASLNKQMEISSSNIIKKMYEIYPKSSLATFVIYQKELTNFKKYSFIKDLVDFNNSKIATDSSILINVIDNENLNTLPFNISFDAASYKEESISSFYKLCKECINQLKNIGLDEEIKL